MITKEKLIDSVEKIISLNHPPVTPEIENGDLHVYEGKCLKDFIMIWCQYSASEDFGIDFDETYEIYDVVHKLLGTTTSLSEGISDDVNYAISGAEMRQVMTGDFLSIYWEWDGTSIFILKEDLPRFRQILEDYKGDI